MLLWFLLLLLKISGAEDERTQVHKSFASKGDGVTSSSNKNTNAFIERTLVIHETSGASVVVWNKKKKSCSWFCYCCVGFGMEVVEFGFLDFCMCFFFTKGKHEKLCNIVCNVHNQEVAIVTAVVNLLTIHSFCSY